MSDLLHESSTTITPTPYMYAQLTKQHDRLAYYRYKTISGRQMTLNDSAILRHVMNQAKGIPLADRNKPLRIHVTCQQLIDSGLERPDFSHNTYFLSISDQVMTLLHPVRAYLFNTNQWCLENACQTFELIDILRGSLSDKASKDCLTRTLNSHLELC